MLYNINMGIGWASSGVEYAQLYRAKILRKLKIPAKFIFTDLILNENIEHLTANIGFKDNEVIWMYHFFTDISLSPTTYTVHDIEEKLGVEIEKREKSGKILRLFYENNQKFVTCYLTDENKDLVDRAEFVSDGKLIRKDYYNYTRYCSEFFAPLDNVAHLYLRRFYNEDGTVAFDEVIDGEQHIYRFKDQILFSREELIAYFLKCLKFSKDDVIIIDRSSEIGQAVLEVRGDAKLGSVVHAEHYSENATTDQTILWNNYYEYEFMHADHFDFFICSTEAQSKTLRSQFKKYLNQEPKVVTIPVGALEKLSRPRKKRREFGLITASRLASEKHIDWLILAVVKAKKVLPDLSFDIYGKGGEEDKLRKIIKENHAEDYIRLMGHADMKNVYKQYQAYIAGSTSEGFGLTLMEAVGSGLPIIGFDVPYGNITFIENEKNGLLIPKESSTQEEEIVSNFADAIIKMYTEYTLTDWQQHSYKIAEPFLFEEVANRWQTLWEEMTHA